jgi:hypothetical protein
LTLRARCFYYGRKHADTIIDFEAYQAHVLGAAALATERESVNDCDTDGDLSKPAAGAVPGSKVDEPHYPTSFADVVAMINAGVAIPGVKEIPSIVLPDKTTAAKADKRRKPWETAPVESYEGLTQSGTFGDRRDEVITQLLPEI